MTAKFINIPPLDIGDKPEQWILTEDCIYQSDLVEYNVVVKAGFNTDLASIPRIFRLLFVKNGLHRSAAIVHDHLCRLGLLFSRDLADRIFLEAMRVSGVSRFKSRMMFFAVSLNTKRLKLIGKAT